ncbi:hypothetical protein LDL36_17905 [Komagataeibacter sp. FNDCR1]|nr:hypothetical protein [Komagataeibacter sp. FNDCR1]
MKKFRLSRKALLGSTLAMTTLLTGCAQTTVGEAERAVKGNTADVESYLNKSRIPLQPANVASVQYSDGVWATASVIAVTMATRCRSITRRMASRSSQPTR